MNPALAAAAALHAPPCRARPRRASISTPASTRRCARSWRRRWCGSAGSTSPTPPTATRRWTSSSSCSASAPTTCGTRTTSSTPRSRRASRRAPAKVADEHVEHTESIAALREEAAALRNAPEYAAAALALRLYRHLALFVAENLQHMHIEETVHNALLWQHYSDAELGELHGRLLASIGPADKELAARWMLPASTPAERAAMIGGMKAELAPEALLGLMSDAAPAPRRRRLGQAGRAAGVSEADRRLEKINGRENHEDLDQAHADRRRRARRRRRRRRVRPGDARRSQARAAGRGRRRRRAAGRRRRQRRARRLPVPLARLRRLPRHRRRRQGRGRGRQGHADPRAQPHRRAGRRRPSRTSRSTGCAPSATASSRTAGRC